MSRSSVGSLTLLLRKAVIYPLTIFYSFLFCLWLLYQAIARPGRKFWRHRSRPVRPKCLEDPKLGQHHFVKVNGINIHYVEKGNRENPLMLFIHGFPEFWFSWRHQMEEFSKDYWTVAMDLRGFGDSDRPSEQSAYLMTNVIEDVRQLVKHLGKEKFVLVAHDWGGVIAWNFLDNHHDQVSQYIIMGAPHCRTWMRVMFSSLRQFLMGWYVCFFQMPILPELSLQMMDFAVFNKVLTEEGATGDEHSSLEVIEAYKYMFSRPGATKSALDYYRANCGNMVQSDKAASRLPDGFFLFGDNDAYLVTDYLETAKEMIPNLQTLILKDCSHFLQQSKPGLVNAAMRSFLEKNKPSF